MKPIGETTGKEEGDRNIPVVLYLAPWAFVVLASLKLKHQLLVSEGGGYDFLAEVLGLGHGGSLSLSQRLALFRADVLVSVVIGGIAFLGLVRMVSPRHRPWVAWLVSTTLFLVLYAQLKSWWEVGTFVSAKLMAAGLFGSGRELIGEYATSASVMRLLVALFVLTLVCIGLALLERRAARLKVPRGLDWTSWPLAASAAALVIASWSARVPATPYDRPAMTTSLAAFAGRAGITTAPPDLRGVSGQELVSMYARVANAPVPNGQSVHFGKARGYDVVFILLESMPEVCYAIASASGVLPGLRELEPHSFVANAHYSTYPYSRSAYSSIFASWYPLAGIRGDIERYGRISRELRTPGVVHSAAVAGYRTAAFVPERPVGIEEDELRYAAFGFTAHEVPPSAYEKPEGFALDGAHRNWVRVRDRESFDHLKVRVASAITDNQRFLYSFSPQLTHGPWPGLTEAATRDETCRAGFGLLGEVDAMVGELVALLREKKRLDKTLIVVTGDHGLRARREYPPFHAGTLDDVTFHVPLLLHAPGIVTSTARISWMTSHIDIAPSVLDLLGIETDRSLELGSPMWEPKVAERATFFFAKGYLGADGFQRAGQAVMVRYLYGGVSRSDWEGVLKFDAMDLLRRPDSALLSAVDHLTTITAIQTELSRTMLPSVGRLSRPPAERRGTADVRIAAEGPPSNRVRPR